MKKGNDLRRTAHYILFRIGADTDIKNGRTAYVEQALKQLEEKEDYVACMALADALAEVQTNQLQEIPAAAQNLQVKTAKANCL